MKRFKMIFGLLLALSLVSVFQNCSGIQFNETQVVELGSLGEPIVPIGTPPVCRPSSAPEVKPRLKWDWYPKLDQTNPLNFPTFSQVMVTPLIKDLNRDGVPEVVFVTFSLSSADHFYPGQRSHYSQNGVLRIINGADGSNLYSVGGQELSPAGVTTPIILDLDNDGFFEIVYLHHSHKKMIALNHDSTHRWTLDLPIAVSSQTQPGSYKDFASGKTVLAFGNFIYQENALKQPEKVADVEGASQHMVNFFMPLDPSKPHDVSLINHQGTFNPKTGKRTSSFPFGAQTAVGDLDESEPGLEVVGMSSGSLYIFNPLTNKVLVQKDLSQYNDLLCPSKNIGGGPPSLGNFDGDPLTTEIAVATGRYLTVFDSKGNLLAQSVTQDCSSLVTGLSSFDFNGDGKPEIIYSDEEYFRIYEIQNNQLVEVFKEINPSGTLYEYPVVVDVDGNGSSEIVLASNSYPALNFYRDPGEEGHSEIARHVTGVRAFEASTSQAWMPTRSSWTQHAYNPLMELLGSTHQDLVSLFSGYMSKTFRRNSQLGAFEPSCL